MRNIINYCVNRNANPNESPNISKCNPIYESSQFKKLDDTTSISQLNKSQYKCEDTCNLQGFEKPNIKK